MHERFLVVRLSRRLVASCAETRKAFVVNERLHRVKACNDYVDSQVKLDSIEEQRVVQVALHHDILALQRVWQISQFLE